MSSDKEQQGKLIIVSAPSGAGKTTIVRHLLSSLGNLAFSISACSRAQRPGEVDGRDYYFISSDEFKKKIEGNEFVEWEEVYPGSYYGTLKSELERIWNDNKHVVFDVDVVGAVNLKNLYGNRALSVFIMPPSIGHLEHRLRLRDTETPETLARRLDKAERELAAASQFDAVIMNDDLNTAREQAVNLTRSFLAGYRVGST